MNTSKQAIVDYLIEMAAKQVADGITREMLSPSGRRPPPKLVKASQWYLSLGPDQQELLKLIVSEASHASLYRMLLILDGRTAFPEGIEGFRLLVDEENAVEPFLLNSEGSPELTDAYKDRKAPWGMTQEEWQA
jgi:hypothetical protein